MRRLLFLPTLVLALVSNAVAQDPKKPGPPMPPERPAQPPRPMSAEAMVDLLLQRMDSDKDGRISKTEARNRVADQFAALDVNKDGYLDKSELMTVARRMTAAMPGPGPMGGPSRPGGFPARIDPLDFDALDRDADGRLTPAELRGSRFADAFTAIDKNKDGKIDPKEWAAYHFRRP